MTAKEAGRGCCRGDYPKRRVGSFVTGSGQIGLAIFSCLYYLRNQSGTASSPATDRCGIAGAEADALKHGSGESALQISGELTARDRGGDVEKNRLPSSEQHDAEEVHGLGNMVKLILLAAILIGAWFLLDWLINGK